MLKNRLNWIAVSFAALGLVVGAAACEDKDSQEAEPTAENAPADPAGEAPAGDEAATDEEAAKPAADEAATDEATDEATEAAGGPGDAAPTGDDEGAGAGDAPKGTASRESCEKASEKLVEITVEQVTANMGDEVPEETRAQMLNQAKTQAEAQKSNFIEACTTQGSQEAADCLAGAENAEAWAKCAQDHQL